MDFNIPGVEHGSDMENLFKSAGFVVVNWGHCEQSLEMLVGILFSQYGGNKLPKRKRIPKQLSDKIEFVNECIAQIPLIAAFSGELEKIMADFTAIKQTRHDLIHGALTDYHATNGVFSFIRLETHPDIHEVKPFEFDLKEFPSLASTLLRLGENTARIVKRIFDARS